jgi:putative chitinase
LKLPISTTQIAALLKCPAANVSAYWPQIEECLESLGLGSVNSKIAALATIAVETAHTFKPVHEYGSEAYLNKMYDTRTDLGNTAEKDGDGAKFAGRGFIQITGEFNYEHYGKQLGINLVANPDEACEKNAACAIFAAFWYDKKLDIYADAEQWTVVRKKINGGTNGLADFLHFVNELKAAIDAQKSNADTAAAGGLHGA